MLIDSLLPEFDATRIEHRVVPGDIEAVYEATLRLTSCAHRKSRRPSAFYSVHARRPNVLSRAVRRRPAPAIAEPPSLRLADLPRRGEWVLLGENPPAEIAFGVVGRFWAGETVWERIDAADFAAYDRPGFAKIACSFSLRQYGRDRTLVTYECRTRGTDPQSSKAFLRYWRALSPFIGVVLRAQLRVVESEVSAP